MTSYHMTYEHMYDLLVISTHVRLPCCYMNICTTSLLLYEHMYDFLVIWIVWTDASFLYEHMYDFLYIGVLSLCLEWQTYLRVEMRGCKSVHYHYLWNRSKSLLQLEHNILLSIWNTSRNLGWFRVFIFYEMRENIPINWMIVGPWPGNPMPWPHSMKY